MMPNESDVSSVVPELLALCPGIEAAWQEHLAFWKGDKRGEYNDIAVVAHYIVDSYSSGTCHFFSPLFQKVESILEYGHPQQQELLIVGLLEDMQNIASHRDFGWKVFETWLGPKSLATWNAIELAWEGKSSLMEIVREEKRHKQS